MLASAAPLRMKMLGARHGPQKQTSCSADRAFCGLRLFFPNLETSVNRRRNQIRGAISGLGSLGLETGCPHTDRRLFYLGSSGRRPEAGYPAQGVPTSLTKRTIS